MKLFKYEGYEVRVAPEALALRPFKKLWDRDKSKTKEKATNEFAFLYFYCDPRSDYQYIVDDEDRKKAVKEGIGLDESWAPDKAMEDAIVLYKSFEAPSSALLRAALEGVEKVQKLLKEFEPDDTKSLKEYLMAMKLIPEVAAMIQEAEKKINDESEYGEARGSMEKAMFDDGLDEVADWVDDQSKKS